MNKKRKSTKAQRERFVLRDKQIQIIEPGFGSSSKAKESISNKDESKENAKSE